MSYWDFLIDILTSSAMANVALGVFLFVVLVAILFSIGVICYVADTGPIHLLWVVPATIVIDFLLVTFAVWWGSTLS